MWRYSLFFLSVLNVSLYIEAGSDQTQSHSFLPLTDSSNITQKDSSDLFEEDYRQHAIDALLSLKQHKIGQSEKLTISHILNPIDELQPEFSALSANAVDVPHGTANQNEENSHRLFGVLRNLGTVAIRHRKPIVIHNDYFKIKSKYLLKDDIQQDPIIGWAKKWLTMYRYNNNNICISGNQPPADEATRNWKYVFADFRLYASKGRLRSCYFTLGSKFRYLAFMHPRNMSIFFKHSFKEDTKFKSNFPMAVFLGNSLEQMFRDAKDQDNYYLGCNSPSVFDSEIQIIIDEDQLRLEVRGGESGANIFTLVNGKVVDLDSLLLQDISQLVGSQICIARSNHTTANVEDLLIHFITGSQSLTANSQLVFNKLEENEMIICGYLRDNDIQYNAVTSLDNLMIDEEEALEMSDSKETY